MKHHEQPFRIEAATASLVALAALAVLTLIFPNYTVTTPGPFYSASQLALISAVSVSIYGSFVFTQTVRHREYFSHAGHANAGEHAHQHTGKYRIDDTNRESTVTVFGYEARAGD